MALTRMGTHWQMVAGLLMVVIVTAFGQDPCTQPGVVFCSGLEESSPNSNWRTPKAMSYVQEDPGPFNTTGNKVLYFPKEGASLDRIFSDQGFDTLYLRVYVKYETGFSFGVQMHCGIGIRARSGSSGVRPDGTDWFGTRMEVTNPSTYGPTLTFYTYHRGMYMDCSNPNGSCWGDLYPCMAGSNYCTNPDHGPLPGKTPPKLSANKWFCHEAMLIAGDPVMTSALADGALNYWVDGQETGPWTGMWFRSVPSLLIDRVQVRLYVHNKNQTAGMYLDDVVASTKPIGCGTRVVDLPVGMQGRAPARGTRSVHNFGVVRPGTGRGVRFSFYLESESDIAINVFNLHGSLVGAVASGIHAAGPTETAWEFPAGSSGVYLCQLEVNGEIAGSRIVPLLDR